MLQRLVKLNEERKYNKNKLIYRIEHDSRNYYVLNSKGVRYFNIQTLRDIVSLLRRNTAVYISNISELNNATKVNKLYYLNRKDWAVIKGTISKLLTFSNIDTFIIDNIENVDLVLSKQVLRGSFTIILEDIYYRLIQVNKTLYLVSDVKFVIDNYTRFSLSLLTLENIKINNVDISRVTDLTEFFCGDKYLKTVYLNNFDSKNVIEFTDMFAGCELLKNINIEAITVSEKARSISGMFKFCLSLEELNLSHFNTSNVINYSNMFYKCNSLRNIDINNWVIAQQLNKEPKLKDRFNNMFFECNKLDKNCIHKLIHLYDINILFGL